MTKVAVIDGPVVSGAGYKQSLTVAHSTSDDVPAVDSEIIAEGAASSPDRERFTIWSTVEVLAGAGTVRTARQRAYAIAGAAGDAVAADRKLAGTVMYAEVTALPLRQEVTPEGLLVTVMLGVACDAYTGR